VTINHDFKLLRKMFRWFVREGLIDESPFVFRREVVVKLDRETPRDRRFATAADEAKLLKVAEPLLRDLAVFMLDTCCRPGEGLNLQWQDVDFLRREVTIRPEKAKTRDGRCLPLTERLLAILKVRRLDPDGKQLPPAAYVFGDEVGGRVASVRRQWERARTAAGLGDLHLADLRHEAGSAYEEHGMPTTYVSKMLGHRNLATTTRYLNPTTQHLHRAVERRDEARRTAAEAEARQQYEGKAQSEPQQIEGVEPTGKPSVS
jgi:integrase